MKKILILYLFKVYFSCTFKAKISKEALKNEIPKYFDIDVKFNIVC